MDTTFPRSEYYSQTEVTRKFRVSVKQYKELIHAHGIEVVSRKANLGEYTVDTVYVRKSDIDNLNLQLRHATTE